MQDFLKDIQTISWWLEVIMIGLLVNLASDYLKPLLDSLLLKKIAKKVAITTF